MMGVMCTKYVHLVDQIGPIVLEIMKVLFYCDSCVSCFPVATEVQLIIDGNNDK